ATGADRRRSGVGVGSRQNAAWRVPLHDRERRDPGNRADRRHRARWPPGSGAPRRLTRARNASPPACALLRGHIWWLRYVIAATPGQAAAVNDGRQQMQASLSSPFIYRPATSRAEPQGKVARRILTGLSWFVAFELFLFAPFK